MAWSGKEPREDAVVGLDVLYGKGHGGRVGLVEGGKGGKGVVRDWDWASGHGIGLV